MDDKVVVSFVNGEQDLIFLNKLSETPLKYKYRHSTIPEWYYFINKKHAIYVGKLTEEALEIQDLYRKAQQEIVKQKEIQKKLIMQLNSLSSNENIVPYEEDPDE